MNESVPTFTPEQLELPGALRALGGRALAIGLAGGAATVAGFVVDPEHFFPAYLSAWLLWFSVATGCLGLLLMHHLSGGRWGIVLRRAMEAGARTIPIAALFAVPLLLRLDRLFVWADPATVAGDHLLQHKASYLNPLAFTVRFVVIVAIFTLYAYLLSKRSAEQDAEGDRGRAYNMMRISSVGFLIYVLAMSFLGIDWLMSLDPHWFSSLYGAIYLAGSGMAALCFLILVARSLVRRDALPQVLTGKRFHDFGTLLFAFVMFFTYLAISQFIIAYQGNLPEEVVWFNERFHGGWAYVATAMLVFHFFVPFLVLLHRPVKRRAAVLAKVAAFLLFMRWADMIWESRPSLVHEGLGLGWIDIAAVVGLGGLWIFFYSRELGRRALLPIHDPSLAEALVHE